MFAKPPVRSPWSQRAIFWCASLFAVAAVLYLTPLRGTVVAAAPAAATCTVTNSADKGPGTLRWLLGDSTCDSIDFAPGVTHIVLGGALELTRSVQILGPGADLLTIDGDNQWYPVFTAHFWTPFLQELEAPKTEGDPVKGGDPKTEDPKADPGVVISGLTITGGRTGIQNDGGTLTLRRVVVADNHVDWDGAGIYSFGTLHLVEVLVVNNTAQWGLGGGVFSAGELVIENSTFSGNSAERGGGVFAIGQLRMINSTIAGNAATGFFGGLALGGAGPHHIVNTTVANNTATHGEAGIGTSKFFGVATMKNTIVVGNSPENCGFGLTTSGVNLSDDATCLGFLQVTDMHLGPLADNGGSTWTMALLDGSPAIDVATDCTDHEFNPVLTDQRGVVRPGGAACDAGAYESVVKVVEDTEAPVFGPLPDLAFQATSSLGAIVSYGVDVTDNEDPNPSVVCVPPSNSTFAIGETTVECTATDAAGNSASALFTVTVVDTIAPVVIYSGNAGTYQISDTVHITCTATDAVGVVSTTCIDIVGPATSFEVGVNTVTSTATDAAGNTGTATTTFTVEVTSTGLQDLITEIVGESAPQLVSAVQSIASAPNATVMANRVTSFKNQVNAQLKSGKITTEQAALLNSLVDEMQ